MTRFFQARQPLGLFYFLAGFAPALMRALLSAPDAFRFALQIALQQNFSPFQRSPRV
jgi:hypothetical protein